MCDVCFEESKRKHENTKEALSILVSSCMAFYFFVLTIVNFRDEFQNEEPFTKSFLSLLGLLTVPYLVRQLFLLDDNTTILDLD